MCVCALVWGGKTIKSFVKVSLSFITGQDQTSFIVLMLFFIKVQAFITLIILKVLMSAS